MIYTATVTSQGQITIPAVFRREMALERSRVTIKRIKNGGLEIEKAPDILSLAGSLSKHAKNINKGLSGDEIIRREKKAVEKTRIEDYKKSFEHMSDELLIITPNL